MGQSATARLAYGYDLGGDEEGWKIAEADEDGTLTLTWMGQDEGEPDVDFIECVEERLLAVIAGFAEKWAPKVDGYWDRQRAAKAQVGLTLSYYGTPDYSGWVLHTHSTTVDWGAAKEPLDLAALAAMAEAEGWDAKLAAGIEALGITPTQAKPGWILSASYG